MALLDELVAHFRAEADRLAHTPFADKAVADARAVEQIAQRRAQQAQAAFAKAETEIADWLTGRLHPVQPTAEPPAEAAPAAPAAPQPPVAPAAG